MDASLATHGAWMAGLSGYAFTEGQSHEALGVLLCPTQGVVSVWVLGKVPTRLASKVKPWVLVKGPGCAVLRGWPGQPGGGYKAPGGTAAGGGGAVAGGPDPSSNTSSGATVAGDATREGFAVWRTGEAALGIEVPTPRWRPLGHPWMDLWINTIAEAYGVPPLLVGMVCLGTLAAALASKFSVHMQVWVDVKSDAAGGKVRRKATRWKEPTVTLYAITIAPSGVRKTPILDYFLAPFRAMEVSAVRAHRQIVAQWKNRTQDAQRTIERLTRNEKNAPGFQDEKLVAAQVAVDEPKPVPPQCIVSNATGPAAALAMARQTSVFVATAEVSEVFKALKREENTDVEPYLKGYSGEHQGAVLRIGREQPTGAVMRCSLVGLCAPDGFYGLGESLGARGQGFFARILWVGVDTNAEAQGVVDETLCLAWEARITALTRLPGPTRDAWGSETGAPAIVTMNPEQTAKVLAFESRLRRRLLPGGDLYGIDTWARKAHGQVCRIAGVLSCMDVGLSPESRNPQGGFVIQDWALDWALDLVENTLIAHAQYAAQVMSWPKGTDDAVHLLTILGEKLTAQHHATSTGPADPAAIRQTYAITEIDKWDPRWSTEQTDRALAVLCDRGFASISGMRGPRSERVVTFRRP
jgi:hypothetical protein